KCTEICVPLKPVPQLAFSQDGSLGVRPNQLVLTVQPNEGVTLQLGAKIPGTRMVIRPVNMEFLYGTAFLSQSPEAYERLITDAMRGDATLFTRDDEVEAALRELLARQHAEDSGYVPARVLNMIVFADRQWSGEVANRLRGVGRYNASRLLLLEYEPGRERLDARVTIASERRAPGE